MKNNKFNKTVSSIDVFVLSFGAMIGWGWIVSSGTWIQNAGVLGTIIGFITGGILIYFVGMIYAELISAMPQAGGEHVFSYMALGKNGSFLCTWILILSYVGVVCFEAVSFPKSIQYIFPLLTRCHLYVIAGSDVWLTSVLITALFTIIIVIINIIGIKAASVFQIIFTTAIAIISIIFIIASIMNGSSHNIEAQLVMGNGVEVLKNIASVAIVAPFFLFGFDIIPQVSEELNIPVKKATVILLISIISAVAFYGGTVLAVGYSMSSHEIFDAVQSSELIAALAMEKVFPNKIMVRILIFGGVCGIVTTWNSFLIGGSRAIFSMAESKMLPSIFSKLHPKYNTPVNAILLIGFISFIAPFFGEKMLIWISNTASFACCAAYCIVALSFMILRVKIPEMERPYKLRNYKFTGICALILSGSMLITYIIPVTGNSFNFYEWIIIIMWSILGIVFYIFCKNKYGSSFGKLK